MDTSRIRSEAETPTGKLEKIDRIRALFLWPMGLWLVILIADFVVYIVEVEAFRSVRVFIGELAFYTLPLLLMYLVVATFYSSYKILGSRGHRNIATFFLFQFLAFFVVVELGIELPTYSKSAAAGFTAVIALAVLITVVIVERLISASGDRLPEASRERRQNGTGMVVAALVSLLIASMVYFRVKGGIAFVSWGVFFGVTLSAMFIRSEKLILAILYFLDPNGAATLYQLIRLRERVDAQKDRTDVEREQGDLDREAMRTTAVRLANELEHELSRAHFRRGEERIRYLIDALRHAESLPASEQERRLEEVHHIIAQLRNHGEFPLLLPEVGGSGMSLGEKVVEQVGLSPDEVGQAVSEGLIDEQQAHLWTPAIQVRLRGALLDLENNRVKGAEPIYVADGASEFLEKNKFVFEKLVQILGSPKGGLSTSPLKGLEPKKLSVLEFTTVTSAYSCVLRYGPEGAYLVLGVFDKR